MERKTNTNDLARLVTRAVNHAQAKFTDPERKLTPNFMLSFSLNKIGVDHAVYTPILNHWGATEMDYLLTGKGAIVLPWPHSDTYRYLTDSPDNSETSIPLVLFQEGNWAAVTEGVRAGQIIFSQFPDSIRLYSDTLSGGTRVGKDKILAKMSRPWQTEMSEHNSENCALCGRSSEAEQNMEDLILLQNMFTPYPFHKMIIPKKEFYEMGGNDKYFLYNSNGLSQVLEFAQDVFPRHNLYNAHLGIHIGTFAGQNIPHLHVHFLSREKKD